MVELKRVEREVWLLLTLASPDDRKALHDRLGAAVEPILAKLEPQTEVPAGRAEIPQQATENESARSAAPVEAAPVDTAGTAELLDGLYRLKDGRFNKIRNFRGRLDWDAVWEAHLARPIRLEFLPAFLDRRDCSEQQALRLAHAHPRGLDMLLDHGWKLSGAEGRQASQIIPVAEVRPLLAGQLSPETMGAVLDRLLGRDLTATDLLTELRPARTVLRLAYERTIDKRRDSGEPKSVEFRQFRKLLADLVADRLGDRVPVWMALRIRLSKFDGTVAELIDAAVTAGSGPSASTEDWPDGAEAPHFSETPALHTNRAAFVTLLSSATTDTQWTLLPYLDGRTRYDLLVRSEWRDEWLDRIVDDETAALLSRHVALPATAIDVLAVRDDPAVNRALIYHGQTGDDRRLRLVTGMPFAPGNSGQLPLDAQLRKFALGEWAPHWLAPLVYAHDPELVSHCLHKLRWPQNRILRVVAYHWERDGRDGLLELLPDTTQKGVRTLLTELMADPEPDAALERLRAAAREAESPAGAARRLRGGTAPADLLAEGFRWDWDHLVAEHRANPFDSPTLEGLTWLDDCPPMLRDAPQFDRWRLSDDGKRALKALVGGKPAAKVLATIPLPSDVDADWLAHAVHFGDLTWVDILRYGRPGRAALRPELADETYRTELAALVEAHLAGRPEAWLLALAMLPDFDGTVPELLRSAGLAAG